MLFANWARHFGRKKESKLFAKWDGPPTTRFLRSDNTEYNTYKRDEIKKYLKMMFNNIKMPTIKEEQANRDECDKKYEAYISNLRTLTRDSKEFALLQSENRNYGMWRNLYGLKIVSIVVVSIIFFSKCCIDSFIPLVYELDKLFNIKYFIVNFSVDMDFCCNTIKSERCCRMLCKTTFRYSDYFE